jgi:hypothetical protein
MGEDERAFQMLESIADILVCLPVFSSLLKLRSDQWTRKNCPFSVLSCSLESILHASLNTGALAMPKFARWLRAVCTILLARGSLDERIRAAGYMEQAAAAMKDTEVCSPTMKRNSYG